MKFFQKIALVFSLCVLALAIASFIFIADPPSSEIAQADENDNLVGHAWNDNTGWVSFNCMNHHQLCENDRTVLCDLDQDCVDAGVGGTCLNECSASDYGVTVSDSNGKFSGYAWSSNLGWVDFGPNPPYPSSPNTVATYDSGTGAVTGWAKIVNQGDDGWIKMSGSWSDGVSVSSLNFSGWAWNGNSDGSGVGWFSFNCADSGAGGCGSSNYNVSINRNPSAINLEVADAAFCEYPGPKQDVREPILRWEFSDANTEDTQKAYELVLSESPSYTSPLINTGKVLNSAASQYAVDLSDGLDYDKTYYWRVRVWDNHNYVSDWGSSSFTTDKHAYPDITDFSASPSEPRALEDTFFSATAKTYGNSLVANNGWVFTSSDTIPSSVSTSTASTVNLGGGTTQSTTSGAGPMQFQSSGSGAGAKEVILRVTDTDGYYCELPLSVNTKISLPIWQEIKPQ